MKGRRTRTGADMSRKYKHIWIAVIALIIAWLLISYW